MNNDILDKQVKNWRLDSNIVLLYPKYENISDLEMDWDKFIAMNKDLQNDSDEKSIELFGNTNQDRYEIMLHKFYDEDSIDNNEFQFNKDKHDIDQEVDDLYFTINFDKDRYFYRKYMSASIQESINEFIPSEEYISNIESRILDDNPDIIDESVIYPYYTPKEIEYYDKKYFKNVKLHLKESFFVSKWKKAYNEGFETGDFNKLKVLNTEWKDKVEEINDSNLSKDNKNKALLNLGCNYSLPISSDSLVKQSERVKNAISSLYSNIRIYTVNDTEESIEDNRRYEDERFNDFVTSMGLWIVDNKSFNRITVSFYRTIPYYGANDMDNTVDIYCARLPEWHELVKNHDGNRYPSTVTLKYLLASLVNNFNKSISIFKVFSGEYRKFNKNCLGLHILYRLYNDKYDIMPSVESTDIFSEANTTNEFPVEFNKDGDLLISKGRKIDFEGEYSRTHLALKIYEKNNNIVGMKYCICKLWYLNTKLEEKIHDKKTTIEEKKKAEKARSKIVNDITKYSQIVLKKDPNFDIIKSYQNSPFNDDKIRIPTSTLDHTLEWIKRILNFKKGF